MARLRELYQQQLQRHARFVRYFEMRSNNSRIQYYLFFASNHRLGHANMKEAMWAADPSGEFRFSDATDPSQAVLFEADHTPALWLLLRQRFAGQWVLTDTVLRIVEDETAFLQKHAKATLRMHEGEKIAPEERLTVAGKKVNGVPRRKGTFPPGLRIHFPD